MNISYTLEILENTISDITQSISDTKQFIKPPYSERVSQELQEYEDKLKELKEVKTFLESNYK